MLRLFFRNILPKETHQYANDFFSAPNVFVGHVTFNLTLL